MPSAEALVSRPRRPRSAPKRVLRWRFPAGTIHLVGGGLRWERTEDEGRGGQTLYSGPLELCRGVGYLGAADVELPLASSLDEEAYQTLPEFRFCHVFYDTDLAGPRVGGFGPWFCLCGCRGTSLGRLLSACRRAGDHGPPHRPY